MMMMMMMRHMVMTVSSPARLGTGSRQAEAARAGAGDIDPPW